MTDHYARPGLSQRILDALAQAGKDVDHLAAEDLAPLDEFHVRGREATLELARAAELATGMRVLDVGSGLGGPSRALARDWGCHVTGIDLTEDYCAAAAMLADRLGLSMRVEYQAGDALALPFADDSFDRVWTQHTAMNIADKAALYAGMYRVLKPGGLLAIYDVLQGPGGPSLFPVPWARDETGSFLATPDELRSLLQGAGFVVEAWSDSTEAGRKAFARAVARMEQQGLPPLGIHLLLGDGFMEMARNQWRNLEEGRILLAQVIARKPAEEK